MTLFPSDRAEVIQDDSAVHIIVGAKSLNRPRQWPAYVLYQQFKFLGKMG